MKHATKIMTYVAVSIISLAIIQDTVCAYTVEKEQSNSKAISKVGYIPASTIKQSAAEPVSTETAKERVKQSAQTSKNIRSKWLKRYYGRYDENQPKNPEQPIPSEPKDLSGETMYAW